MVVVVSDSRNITKHEYASYQRENLPKIETAYKVYDITEII